jgi:hypothetical protein
MRKISQEAKSVGSISEQNKDHFKPYLLVGRVYIKILSNNRFAKNEKYETDDCYT